jgi:tetratricopeptide (TPR) repeat protein
MDSMGWVEFRLGDYPAALSYLKQAYAQLADPEIAAHLVEALLQTGDNPGAHSLWLKAIQANPNSDMLRRLETRFKP